MTPRRRLFFLTLILGGWATLPSAWSAPRFYLFLSMGPQYSHYASPVLSLAEADRAVTLLIPMRFELGSYLSLTDRWLAGLVLRSDLESNYNPFDPRGVITYGLIGANLSTRYLFPVVLGEKLSGGYLRLDVGLAGLTHPTSNRFPVGLDALVGFGYSISILSDRSAIVLEIGYAPRFIESEFNHSAGLTAGLML